MRLITFQEAVGQMSRLGALVGKTLDFVLDLSRSQDLCSRLAIQSDSVHSAFVSGDMTVFLAAGDEALGVVDRLVQYVESVLDEDVQCQDLLTNGILRPTQTVRFLPAVHRPGKIVCVGLNFQSHIDEAIAAGQKLPQTIEVPGAFNKVTTALVGHKGDILYPACGGQLDYEVELAMIIGRRCKNIRPDDYKKYVAGLSIGVDLSLRDVLFRSPHPFEAKNYDTFCPLGPALVTLDDLSDPDELMLRLWVNGELRQEESMRNALFSCGDVLAYWSARMTFEPGDVVLMGTPAGVGIFGKDPERMLLRSGDKVTAQIDGLGELCNQVVPADSGLFSI